MTEEVEEEMFLVEHMLGLPVLEHGYTNWYSAQESDFDEMVVTTKGGDWYDGGWLIDFHQHNYKNTNPSVNNNWNSHYGAVATTNELLASGLRC